MAQVPDPAEKHKETKPFSRKRNTSIWPSFISVLCRTKEPLKGSLKSDVEQLKFNN